MRLSVILVVFAGLLPASRLARAAGESQYEPGPVRLLLPPVIYAVPGIEANVYFDNVVLVLNRAHYAFDVSCRKGRQQRERWTYVPAAGDAGEYAFSLEVRNQANEVIARAASRLRVGPADAGAGREKSVLMIGDSLTAASVYPEHVADLAAGEGQPRLKLIGTRGPGVTEGPNRHEGYGGWTAERFATRYTGIARGGPYKQCGSPFIYKEGDGEPELDFARYCREFNDGTGPDFVTILLGCNDTFSATDENIEERIDRMFGHYETLLRTIHRVRPGTKIGALLLVPPAGSQDAFGTNYRSGQTRWQYRRNQHRVVERMVETFGNRESDNVFLVPAYLNLDCEHNYPRIAAPANARTETVVTRLNNGVHPSADGYRQIGDSIFAWMKSELAKD